MTIEHIAIWTNNLEELRDFYCTFFDGKSNEKYFNPVRKFESYFITFSSGTRLELMRLPDLVTKENANTLVGLAHMAFKVKGNDEVDRLTKYFREQGITIAGEPRLTGDGYYESVILDPDGNIIELIG